ncbi:MAG: DUF72 domain-containing protein [Nanoarchaeota archaeon]|nr:DUF72 domain-containing protein [Nanoarchaeota archaeon]
MNLIIGTSGYSYDDWKGKFYPPTTPSSNMLPFYSKYFGMTEINSTYYRIPPRQMIDRILEKVPEGFVFTIKAYRGITHEREQYQENIDEFNKAIIPMVDSGKGACILLQFPYSFKNEEDNRAFILHLKEKFPLPLVAEFRNSGWITEDTFKLLEDAKIGFCCTDEPDLKGLMPPEARVTSEIGYLRFHGRNKEKWWKPDQPSDRYDYLYTEEELKNWIPKIKAMSELTKKFFVLFNNHPGAKAIQNAGLLSKMLGKEIKLPSEDDYDTSLRKFF